MNAELTRVHQAALAHFEYTADQDRFGDEHWMAPSEIKADLQRYGIVMGDCDDFASYCVMALRELGIPARFVCCQCEDGGYHLVCESDGWILDNRQGIVCRQDDLPYRWISISGFAAGEAWHEIKE